jgi:hypothetical protein
MPLQRNDSGHPQQLILRPYCLRTPVRLTETSNYLLPVPGSHQSLEMSLSLSKHQYQSGTYPPVTCRISRRSRKRPRHAYYHHSAAAIGAYSGNSCKNSRFRCSSSNQAIWPSRDSSHHSAAFSGTSSVTNFASLQRTDVMHLYNH